ncbi:hypothetical protein COO60DRAFT_1557999 [Scenedesmus sp. NREL 46B-D3]|nr:hypothetical protein COO60DRAFT_1557999 [Scenedesmus sp. NREL 46B-D3]
MHLRGATATFASSRTVQFIGNRGTYGAALKAQQSNIQFNGPVLAADNIANAGAGGAFHLVLSNVTFSARATLRNNSLDGCRDEWYFDEGCGGGAMFVRDSQVTHAERAAYLRNTASGADGGAVYIFGLSFGSDSLNSSLLATKVVTFNGNSATRAGGAVWMANAVTFAGGANFLSNSASQEESSGSGGAVHVNPGGALAFGGPATFRNNIASTGGAVTLRGSMSFANNKSRSCWVGNSASVTTGGAALRIEANGRALFGMLAPHNFGPNRGGPLTDRTELDIKVLAGGSYVCDSGQGAGDYNVEGNLCAASCRMRQSCKCPAGQVFAAKQCSCQREV